MKEKMLRLMEELRLEDEDIKPLHKSSAHTVLIKCSGKPVRCRVALKVMNKHQLNK